LRRQDGQGMAMTDRERTIFAAAEAIFGAGFLIAGLLLLDAFDGIISIVFLVFGIVALGQAVAVGAGLMSIGERRRDD
jgi:hypothetical protein